MLRAKNVSLTDLYAEKDSDIEEMLLELANKQDSVLTLDDLKELVEKKPIEIFFSYAETNPTINEFFDTNPDLQAGWQRALTEREFPDFPITSFDGSVTLSVFTQVKGAVLLKALRESNDIKDPDSLSILNRACELGMHDALLKRLQLNIQEFDMRKISSKDALKKALEPLIADAEKIQNLYWTYGCISAGLELLKLANKLMKFNATQTLNERFFMFSDMAASEKFSWIDSYNNEKNLPPFVFIVEVATEYFYLAIELTKFDMSKKIEKVLTDGKGLFGILDDEYNNFIKFNSAVLKKLDEFQFPNQEFFRDKAREKAVELVAKYQSSPRP